MKWPWKKKKDDSPAPEPGIVIPPCPHTWKDFPWWMRAEYDSCFNALHIVIMESYVCVHCGERKNVVLQDCRYYAQSWVDANKKTKEIEDKYKGKIFAKADVEDMINDAILVDREKLKIVEKLKGERSHETDDADISEDEKNAGVQLDLGTLPGDTRIHICSGNGIH